jgi:hypothetical protein
MLTILAVVLPQFSFGAGDKIEEAFVDASPDFFYIFMFLRDQSWDKSITEEAKSLASDDVSANAQTLRGLSEIVNLGNTPNLSAAAKRQILEKHAEMVLPEVYKGLPLTRLEGLALFNYGTEAYKSINPALWSATPSPHALAYRDFMNQALDKLPPFAGTVKRGVRLTTKDLDGMTVGKEIVFRAFTSCTADMNLDEFESDDRLIIHSRNGRDISQLTSHPNEREVLFKAGSRYKVLRRTENVVSAGKTAAFEIELEEL